MKHMFECGMIKKRGNFKSFPQKADIWLVAGILAFSFALLFLFRLNRTPGSFAEVSCDGGMIMKIPLSQKETVYYLLTMQNGLSDGEPKAGTEAASDGGLKVGTEAASAGGAEISGMDAGDSPVSIQTFSEAEWEAWTKTELFFAGKDYNVILCQNGEVQMTESSCPDLICVHHRAIGMAGENIICLPHKIVIEIIGGERGLDGVVY